LIGRKDYNASLPSLGHFAEPNEEMIKELIGLAEQSLKKLGKLEIVGKGRAIRPATDSIIPNESRSERHPNNRCISEEAGRELSGAFVSWGHSAYGLTLGMGTGKLMSQLVIGKKPDIDMAIFDISRGHSIAASPGPEQKGWVMKSLMCNSLKHQPAARNNAAEFHLATWEYSFGVWQIGRLQIGKNWSGDTTFLSRFISKVVAFCANNIL
jgi:hypothetical protein